MTTGRINQVAVVKSPRGQFPCQCSLASAGKEADPSQTLSSLQWVFKTGSQEPRFRQPNSYPFKGILFDRSRSFAAVRKDSKQPGCSNLTRDLLRALWNEQNTFAKRTSLKVFFRVASKINKHGEPHQSLGSRPERCKLLSKAAYGPKDHRAYWKHPCE